MNNGYDLNSGGKLSIYDREWKTSKQQFAGTARVHGPPIGCSDNLLHCTIKVIGKLRGGQTAPLTLPVKSRLVLCSRFHVNI